MSDPHTVPTRPRPALATTLTAATTTSDILRSGWLWIAVLTITTIATLIAIGIWRGGRG